MMGIKIGKEIVGEACRNTSAISQMRVNVRLEMVSALLEDGGSWPARPRNRKDAAAPSYAEATAGTQEDSPPLR